MTLTKVTRIGHINKTIINSKAAKCIECHRNRIENVKRDNPLLANQPVFVRILLCDILSRCSVLTMESPKCSTFPSICVRTLYIVYSFLKLQIQFQKKKKCTFISLNRISSLKFSLLQLMLCQHRHNCKIKMWNLEKKAEICLWHAHCSLLWYA